MSPLSKASMLLLSNPITGAATRSCAVTRYRPYSKQVVPMRFNSGSSLSNEELLKKINESESIIKNLREKIHTIESEDLKLEKRMKKVIDQNSKDNFHGFIGFLVVMGLLGAILPRE